MKPSGGALQRIVDSIKSFTKELSRVCSVVYHATMDTLELFVSEVKTNLQDNNNPQDIAAKEYEETAAEEEPAAKEDEEPRFVPTPATEGTKVSDILSDMEPEVIAAFLSNFSDDRIDEVLESELVNEFDFEDDDFESDRIVMMATSWGSVLPIPFNGDEWKMIHEIAEQSGDDIASVIEDIVTNRFSIAKTIQQNILRDHIQHMLHQQQDDDDFGWNLDD